MMKKRLTTTLLAAFAAMTMMAQGWPSEYQGVMLQGFYWDSYSDSKWTKLEKQADDLEGYINLVWIPQSANCGGTSMGYDDLYWFSNYESSFGNKEQLLSMIKTFKQKGIGTIADVVINHRKNVSSWVDFPRETYNGETYELVSTDICADDDGGATKTWASANGYSLSSYNDTGEGWGGMRDLDHNSQNVQKSVKAYLKMLLNDFGYAGFRYDMVKGYSAEFTKLYNEDSKPTYSVGEYWDGNAATVKKWIDGTGKQSAAFDFAFRYTVRDAINNNDWRKLANTSQISDNAYKRYSVTFVENHDTEKRSNADQDPIRRDTLAANAYLLAMPGTPCIFFKHWMAYKPELKAMIDVRNAAGIHNESAALNFASQQTYYAVRVTGKQGQLMCVVGKDAGSYTPNGAWTRVLSGYHYAYWLANTMNTAWADLPSGEYEGQQSVMLTAVSESADAQLVYTTDGSTPTAQGTKVNSGTRITIEGDVVLKVGLLVNGAVSGIVTRTYTKAVPVQTHDITVYVQDPGWSKMCFYVWGDNGEQNGSWPGQQITDKKTIDGSQWYYQTITLPEDVSSFNIIFNKGAGGAHNQTVDITGVSSDKYYIIGAEDGDGKFTVEDVTSQHTAIFAPTVDGQQPLKVYTLDGRLVRQLPAGTALGEALSGLPRGLYIINKKKVVY